MKVILILEKQVTDLLNNLARSEHQNASLLKTQGQISVVQASIYWGDDFNWMYGDHECSLLVVTQGDWWY